jgi:hypothetical protein
MVQQKDKIASYAHAIQSAEAGNVLELTVEMKDGKRHLRRVWLESTPDAGVILDAIA